jgi:hypothetical protein
LDLDVKYSNSVLSIDVEAKFSSVPNRFQPSRLGRLECEMTRIVHSLETTRTAAGMPKEFEKMSASLQAVGAHNGKQQ